MELITPQCRNPWRKAFTQRCVWLRAVWLGGGAGILQAIINQGDVWLHHREKLETVIKTIASPAISFTLVLISAGATWVQKSSEAETL